MHFYTDNWLFIRNIKENVPTLDQAEIDGSKQKSEQWIYINNWCKYVYVSSNSDAEEREPVFKLAFMILQIC